MSEYRWVRAKLNADVFVEEDGKLVQIVWGVKV